MTRNLSLWWDQLGDDELNLVRPQLTSDIRRDVIIIGGGYTGLWTATG